MPSITSCNVNLSTGKTLRAKELSRDTFLKKTIGLKVSHAAYPTDGSLCIGANVLDYVCSHFRHPGNKMCI